MEVNQETPFQKIRGSLFILPILFFLFLLYILAHFKRAILPNIMSFELYLEYKPNRIFVVLFEIVSILTLILLLVICIILFFKKKILFRKYMIALLSFYSIFLIVDYFWFNLVADFSTSEIAETFNAPYRKLIYRSLIFSVIFIPYLLISKRVKGTFIK